MGPLLRYASEIITWPAKLKLLERSTRRMMTMNRSLHPRSDVFYEARVRGRRCFRADAKAEVINWASHICSSRTSVKNQLCESQCRQISNFTLVRLWGQNGETVSHDVSECPKLAQKEYKQRRDKVAKIIQWKVCATCNLGRKDRWYDHEPKRVLENDEPKIL